MDLLLSVTFCLVFESQIVHSQDVNLVHFLYYFNIFLIIKNFSTVVANMCLQNFCSVTSEKSSTVVEVYNLNNTGVGVKLFEAKVESGVNYFCRLQVSSTKK